MGISLRTALSIQNNDVEICPYIDRHSGKWGYEIAHMERENYRPDITCRAVYDSEGDARKNAQDLIDEIKNMDLFSQKEKIRDLLGDAKEDIQRIVDASKG